MHQLLSCLNIIIVVCSIPFMMKNVGVHSKHQTCDKLRGLWLHLLLQPRQNNCFIQKLFSLYKLYMVTGEILTSSSSLKHICQLITKDQVTGYYSLHLSKMDKAHLSHRLYTPQFTLSTCPNSKLCNLDEHKLHSVLILQLQLPSPSP